MTEKTDWKTFDARLIARAWEDEDFKASLLKEPMTAIQEAGLTLSAGVKLEVVEQSEQSPGRSGSAKSGVHTLVLPPDPEQDETDDEFELSDEELSFAAGGTGSNECATNNQNCATKDPTDLECQGGGPQGTQSTHNPPCSNC